LIKHGCASQRTRARAPWRHSVNGWLAYVAGGVASADIEAIAHQANVDSFSESHIRAGWTAGAGIEYAINKNWSAKLANGVNRGEVCLSGTRSSALESIIRSAGTMVIARAIP
jgi:Outer membrane protein beta-barrel domain